MDSRKRDKREAILEERSKLNTGGRKAQILAIASRVFYEEGYENGSLSAIAQEAGIRKAGIYHYF